MAKNIAVRTGPWPGSESFASDERSDQLWGKILAFGGCAEIHLSPEVTTRARAATHDRLQAARRLGFIRSPGQITEIG